MARYTDLMELKNDTQRKNVTRDRVSEIVYKALANEFGKEYALKLLTDKYITPNAVKTPKMTVIADVGDVEDNGGCLVGLCVEVSVKVKTWNTISRKNGGITYGVCFDDYKEGE